MGFITQQPSRGSCEDEIIQGEHSAQGLVPNRCSFNDSWLLSDINLICSLITSYNFQHNLYKSYRKNSLTILKSLKHVLSVLSRNQVWELVFKEFLNMACMLVC